jgi:precorrin-2/cobalt-factor-2 C20-methyltransferase
MSSTTTTPAGHLAPPIPAGTGAEGAGVTSRLIPGPDPTTPERAPGHRGTRGDGPVAATGTCYGIGVGPGDPELITVKALRILQASPVVLYFSAVGRPSNARRVVDSFLSSRQAELHLVYPVTTEELAPGVSYEELLVRFYDAAGEQLADVLETGTDVAVLCEGDPFFHGSYMYLHNRLACRYPTKVVPGVPSILAGAAVLGAPLVCRDEVLSVLSGTLPVAELESRLRTADAAVVMKVGRNLARVREAVDRAGLLERAWYVERATMADERILPLGATQALASAPYFSMVVIPSDVAGAR